MFIAIRNWLVSWGFMHNTSCMRCLTSNLIKFMSTAAADASTDVLYDHNHQHQLSFPPAANIKIFKLNAFAVCMQISIINIMKRLQIQSKRIANFLFHVLAHFPALITTHCRSTWFCEFDKFKERELEKKEKKKTFARLFAIRDKY